MGDCGGQVVLVRHPAVAVRGICYGRADVPLADPACAAALACRLRPFGGMVWTSPAERCRAVARRLGPFLLDDRLQELDFGAWEKRPWAGVPRPRLDAWAADPWRFRPPGGESGAALVARVRAFFMALPSGRHVVISHGGPLKVLGALLRRQPIDLLAPAPPPGSVTVAAFDGAAGSLRVEPLRDDLSWSRSRLGCVVI